MKKFFAALVLLAIASPAFAGKVTGTYEYTDFTEQYGERSVASAEATIKSKADDVTLVVTGAYGERNTDDASFSGKRVGGQVYIDWTDWLYTRTAASIGDSSPVFAKHDYAQDVNLKASTGTTFLLGARYTDYYGDVNVKAYSAGITQKFGTNFSASYRYTQYDSDLTGKSNGNLVSLKLNDEQGSTQLWLGQADTLYAYDWLPSVGEGKQKSVFIRRVLDLNDNLALNAGFGRAWYETPVTDYSSVTGSLGLSLSW